MNRSELYNYIKEHKLEQEIKIAYHRHYTNVSNEHLMEYVKAHRMIEVMEKEAIRDAYHRMKKKYQDLLIAVSNIIKAIDDTYHQLHFSENLKVIEEAIKANNNQL